MKQLKYILIVNSIAGNNVVVEPVYEGLTLSCPGMGRALIKIGHSNLRPGSKEL